MLITADVAKKLSSNKGRKEYRNSYIRELRGIEIAINRAAKKGRTFVEYRCLSRKVKEMLEKNGYVIRKCVLIDYECYVISWNETN